MLSDGSAIVITVARLLTYDGTSFDGTGLVPDVDRALSSDEQGMYYDFTTDNDPQILKAFSVADSMTGASTVAAVTSEAAAGSTASEAASPAAK